MLATAIIISILFAFGGCGLQEENPPEPEVLLNNADIGDSIFFGSYEQDANTSNGKEDIEWIVLDRQNGKILVISKYALEHCDDFAAEEFGTSENWENSTLRKWLNESFINEAFSQEEQNKIVLSNVVNADTIGTLDRSEEKQKDGGNDTQDKLFLLSIDEAEKYFELDEERQVKATEYLKARGIYVYESGNCLWFLRSNSLTGYFPPAFVNNNGYIEDDGYLSFEFMVGNATFAIRPAMWMSIE